MRSVGTLAPSARQRVKGAIRTRFGRVTAPTWREEKREDMGEEIGERREG
jgi:hypothetical protein